MDWKGSIEIYKQVLNEKAAFLLNDFPFFCYTTVIKTYGERL